MPYHLELCLFYLRWSRSQTFTPASAPTQKYRLQTAPASQHYSQPGNSGLLATWQQWTTRNLATVAACNEGLTTRNLATVAACNEGLLGIIFRS